MKKYFWTLYYKFYKPKNKSQLVKKWARLNYYDFKELDSVKISFSEYRGLPGKGS